jgi:serine/threonine protein kinase/tetratricopeptide (TPR) repeat protein
MIGKTISHYRILSVLGEGGMGVTYRAEDTKLQRIVALKFLTPRSGEDGREIERLIREARAAAQLDHPNVCTVYEIDEAEGRAFLAMACIAGRPLADSIAEGPLPLDEALRIALEVAEGLREAHSKHIVHGDIKPANIMLTEQGQVKIMDFGLAERFEPALIPDMETTSGTVSYMSPERLRGEQADHRSDIWALGVVLYEMLAGRRPFEGEYEQAIVYGVLNVAPEPVSTARTDVPPALERVVERSLEKDAAQRYQSIDEVIADLKTVREDMAVSPRARCSIAVISFLNLTGDDAYDYLTMAIPNLLITSLERSEHLRVVTWERMRDLARQLGREQIKAVDSDLGFELCRLDGVDAVVVGSFTKAGDIFATDAKVLDVGTKDLLVSSSSRGAGVDSILRTQIDELSLEILQGLEVPARAKELMSHPVAELTTSSMEAYDAFLKGRDSLERLYNKDAESSLEQAVALDPDFAVAHLYLAWAYTRLRETRRRNEALERAKALSRRATRREQLYIEASYARTIEQDRDKEFDILRELAAQYPAEKMAHHRLAGYYRGRGRLYQAIEEYNKTLALDPSFGWSMNELGYMYADVGDFEKAAEYFERYASISPGDANPVDSMGELCFRMGRLDEAIARYRLALELKPDFYYACWQIAYISALKEDYSEALCWIERYVEGAPSVGVALDGHRWKCFYDCWLGRFDDSLSEADWMTEKAAAQDGLFWSTEADRMRGWIHLARREYSESRRRFESCLAVIERDPREFTPMETSYSPGSLEQVVALKAAHRFALGLIDLHEGDVGAARSLLAEIADVLPEQAEFLRAEVLLAEGQVEKAIEACEEARPWKIPYMSDTEGMLAYNLPLLKDTLARAYRQKGEVYRAIAEYERLLASDHTTSDRRLSHPLYHYRLGDLCESKGWMEKARDHFRLFLTAWEGADIGSPEVADARSRVE